jgi:CheY-like chemotaxis protein
VISGQRLGADVKTILVVDDNTLIAEMLRQLLDGDYLVQTAPNGKVGVDWAKRHRPDLILMDLTMPVMDGFTATMHLRSDPSTKGIPIIVLSARGDAEDIERALKVGADTHLRKPVEEERLFSEIARLLAR